MMTIENIVVTKYRGRQSVRLCGHGFSNIWGEIMKCSRSLLQAFLVVLAVWWPALPSRGDDKPTKDAASLVDSRYETRKDHDPNGIGKFYLGREIAHVMGFGPMGQGAEWLERAVREKEERLSLLIKSLDLKPGMVIADIGAGSGVISVLMAEKVLPEGKVVAVDVQQEMLDRLRDNLKKMKITNVEPLRGTQKTTQLKPSSIDLAIMVDVYHELEFPYEMLLDISKSLKTGGRLVFVEYRKEDPEVPIKLVHKMTEEQVKKEAASPEFGLKWSKTIGVLPWQHVIVFEKQPANDSTR